MQENSESSNETTNSTGELEKAGVTTAASAAEAAPAKRSFGRYFIMAAVIVVMAVVLLYALERQGRVSTGIFGDVVGSQSVAIVNGEKITRRDHENNVNQLLQMAAAQGVDTSAATAVSELRQQALDNLINGELLRQAAIEAGMAATAEAIDARFAQIANDLGGEELLRTRMTEFEITEVMLRRDIENEILIQGLFDSRFPASEIEVTDAEALAVYESISVGAENIPSFEEIKDQIIEQIKRDRQQLEVSSLIDGLRDEADIEKRL